MQPSPPCKSSLSYVLQRRLPVVVLLLLAATCSARDPDPPKFACQTENAFLLHPCVCDHGGDRGVFITCADSNLATVSIGLANIRKPIDTLKLVRLRASRLHGPIFERLRAISIEIRDSDVREIHGNNVFTGVNRTLEVLRVVNTPLEQFPVEPLSILSRLKVLEIANGRLTEVPANSLAGCPDLEDLAIVNHPELASVDVEAFTTQTKLERLDLHGNGLDQFPKGAFKSLRSVTFFDASHNKFKGLSADYLSDMTKMTWCNVSHNEITDFGRATFARNTLLRVLNMEHNKLRKIGSNDFRTMRFVRRLYLADNEIEEIGTSAFTNVGRIGTISLARNRLTELNFRTFNELKYLEEIDFAENQIKRLSKSSFIDLNNVLINASHNGIEEIEDGTFQDCYNITVLDLSFNALTRVRHHTFVGRVDVNDLRLQHNQLTSLGDVPFANFTGLTFLNVSSNQITTIPKKTFPPRLFSMNTIDASNNSIDTIDAGIFAGLAALRSLNLSRNSLTALRATTFGTIHTLLELDLSWNRISKLARSAFTNLASLRTLDLSHNEIPAPISAPISLNELKLGFNAISEIKPRTWPEMNSLLYLELDSNMLGDTLGAGAFANLNTLRLLNLANNSITTIPHQALGDLRSLQHINLESNRIEKLGKAAFGKLPVAMEIRLAFNGLSEVENGAFDDLITLQSLNMSFNNLEKMPLDAFRGLKSLDTLDLSGNAIRKMENRTHGLLDPLLSIKYVNVSHNHLSFVTDRTFPHHKWIPYRLREVDLSYNTLPVVTEDFIAGMQHVVKLNLSHNILNEIRKGVLPNLPELRILDLSFNELTHIADNTISSPEMNTLVELHMENNRLSVIPAAELASMANLTTLNLRGNRLTKINEEFYRKIRSGAEISLQGNAPHCDCSLRPLLNWLSSATPEKKKQWSEIVCDSPANVAGVPISEVDENVLTCFIARDGEAYEATPDVRFRAVSRREDGLYIKWYVSERTEDIGDFYLTLEPLNVPIGSTEPENDEQTTPTTPQPSHFVFEATVPYSHRQYFFSGFNNAQLKRMKVCVVGLDSAGDKRADKSCRPAGEEFLPQADLGNLEQNVNKAVRQNPSAASCGSRLIGFDLVFGVSSALCVVLQVARYF